MVDSRLRIVASAFPRRCLLLTGAVVIFLAIPGGARAQTTTTLSASQDSWLDKANPDTNHGTDTTLVVDPKASSVKRTFVQFDLSSIPPCATINSATLKLTITTSGASSRAHAVHRLTQSWNEAGVAWKSRDGINSWPNPGGTFNATATATASTGTASGAVISWDVTGDVAAFVAGTAVNNGWVVKDISETGGASIQFLYGSRENAVAVNRPVLEVTFTPPNCEDGNPCTDDTCSPTTGCVHTNNTAPCNDGNACSTADACLNGVCTGGPPLNCNDGNVCTDDTCNPQSGCVHTANTSACDDHNACTTNDTCRNGTCVGGPGLDCNDHNVCTDDSCNPATGCLHVNNSAPCSDGNSCTTDDACSGGLCVGGPPPNCDDSNPCTDDGCDPTTGSCVHTNNTAPCDDNNKCTTSDTCSNGSCIGQPVVCDDGIFCNGFETCDAGSGACMSGTPPTCDDGVVCTSDVCDPATDMCSNAPIAGCCSANAQCDDGDACNGVETCNVSTGACVNGTPVICDDRNVCTVDGCTPATGACTFEPVEGCCNTNADCDDGNACTTDTCDLTTHVCDHVLKNCDDGNACDGTETCDPATGQCVSGTPLDCNDGVVCTADTCDPASGCHNDPIQSCCSTSVQCDNGDVCDGLETCDVATGLCHPGTPLACDDGNPCDGLETCDPRAGCQSGTPPNCNDGAACTQDFCDPASGCVNETIPGCCSNDGECDDHNLCDGLETCVNNACARGPALDCDDGNPCTDDSCDPQLGCVHTDNTAPCDDGNACTSNDTCRGGGCVAGPPLDCDDGNACTNDSCDPTTGCNHSPNRASCDDGNACTTGDTCSGGSCVGGPRLDCDDGNVCTDDTCSPVTGCLHTPNTAACDDHNACTTGDGCRGGACVGGGPLGCDDGNGCTNDGCDPQSGCTHTNNLAACDDGNACSVNDTCRNGTCAGGPPRDCNDQNACTVDSCDPATGCRHDAAPSCAGMYLSAVKIRGGSSGRILVKGGFTTPPLLSGTPPLTMRIQDSLRLDQRMTCTSCRIAGARVECTDASSSVKFTGVRSAPGTIRFSVKADGLRLSPPFAGPVTLTLTHDGIALVDTISDCTQTRSELRSMDTRRHLSEDHEHDEHDGDGDEHDGGALSCRRMQNDEDHGE